MTSIAGPLYSTLSPYTGLSGPPTANSGGNGETQEEAAVSGDTVSLSAEVSTARAREYFGLAPTGKLTLSDFQAAAEDQEASVNAMLTSAMAELGIPEDQDISISLDDDGGIAIAGDFKEKDSLEEKLNQDGDFFQAFSGLSANYQVMDYAQSLTTVSASLVDYIGADTSDTDLLSLASRYSALKSANSIEGLWQISRSQTPYTHVYTADE